MNEKVENELKASGVSYREMAFEEPFETTEKSALMLHTDMEHIAKTLVFRGLSGAVTIIAAGNARTDNHKFKEALGFHPTMMKRDELFALTGFEPGSVSPIGIASAGNKVYMDVSLSRFQGEKIYPSGGTDRCAVEITPEELYKAARCSGIVDVCRR